MNYKNYSFYVTLLVTFSSLSNGQTVNQVKPVPSLNERVEIGDLPVPHIKTEEEVKAEEEAARVKAEAEAEIARQKAEEERLKEMAASEKDAEKKIEQVKEKAEAAKMAEDKSRISEAEAAMAEAKAKELRAIAVEDAELAKKAANDNDTAIKDAELAITKARSVGSILFDKIKLESEEDGAKGAVSVAEAVISEEHEEVSKGYTVERGGSLSLVSVQAYGRAGYWRILKLHNGVSPEKLKVGQKLMAPDLNWLMADSGLAKVFPVACRDLLESRRLFMEVEDELENPGEGEAVVSAEEISEKVNKAVALMNNTRELLMKRTAGVKGSPNSVAQQLSSATSKMEEVAKGKNSAAMKNLVHEHISNSIVYSVLWAKDGFN